MIQHLKKGTMADKQTEKDYFSTQYSHVIIEPDYHVELYINRKLELHCVCSRLGSVSMEQNPGNGQLLLDMRNWHQYYPQAVSVWTTVFVSNTYVTVSK